MSDLRAIPDEEDDLIEQIRKSRIAYDAFVASNPLPPGETWSGVFMHLGEEIVRGLSEGAGLTGRMGNDNQDATQDQRQ